MGCACRLPGAADEAAFWSLLARGECSVSEIPAERWARERFLHPGRGVPGRAYTFAAGVLDDIHGFDPGAFGLSPREAEQIDPQQRLLLELVHEAFEDANIPLSSVAGSATGVFVGASSLDHSLHFFSDLSAADAHFVTGNALSIIANRISHVFNFTGPSLTIDTACSSSLVAFDRAVKAIEAGEIDTAVVAGVNILASPVYFVGFSRAGMLSPTGRCRPFSAQADGYVRAEGGVVTILRRVDAGAAGGATPRAVVVASGTNSDGRTLGIAMPESLAQQRLLEQLYAARDIDPDRLAFVEAHGTGTLVGDPAEARAIGEAIGRRRSTPLPVGSVKSNIGHLEPASGLAGLLKSLQALERRELPATLHLDSLNESIDFEALNIAPAAKPIRLAEGARLAGVSSFGFGGTNAHAVIRLPEPHELPPAPSAAAPVLMISAHSAPALAALAGRYADRLETAPEPARIAHAAARGRSRFPHRLAVAVDDPDAVASLRRAALDAAGSEPTRGVVANGDAGVALIFTGNGGQYPGMGAAAWQTSPAFRDAVEEIDALFEPLAGWSLAAAFRNPPGEAALAATETAQPLLFALEVALARTLIASGCVPAAVVGHSVGEIAAAYVAGALSLKDAVHLIYWRSRLQGETRGSGLMAFVMASPSKAAELIAASEQPDVVIGAFNAPNGVTLSGPRPSVDAVLRLARRQGIVGKRLDIDYAFHSPAMLPLRDRLFEVLDRLQPQAPTIPYFSTVTGEAVRDAAFGADYWWRNIRQPVLFDDAVRAAAKQTGIGIFLEIGPRTVLTGFVREILADAGHSATVLASFQEKDGTRQDPVQRTLLAALVNGAAMDEHLVFGPATAPGRVDLPKTPWNRQSIRPPRTSEAIDLIGAGASDHPLLGARLTAEAREWRGLLDTAARPFLADHKVGGHAVVPATGLAEMALAAGRDVLGTTRLRLEDFDIVTALRLGPDESVETQVRMDRDGHVTIRSRGRGTAEWALHASGRVLPHADDKATRLLDDVPPGETALDAERLYGIAAGLGLEYGPAFRLVRRAERVGQEIRLELAEAVGVGPYVLPPTSADAALHGLVLAADSLPAEGGTAYLPVRFGGLTILGDAPPISALLTVKRASPRALALDVSLFDAAGAEVTRMEGVEFRAVAFVAAEELETDFRQSLVRLGAERSDAAARVEAFVAERAQDMATEDTLLLDALAYSIAHRAVVDVAGSSLTADGGLDVGSLVARGQISGERQGSLLALLDLLAEGGLARHEADAGWQVLPQSDLPAPEPLLLEIAAIAPDRGAEIAMGSHLAAGLADHLRGTATLAPSNGLVEQWESASPAAGALAQHAAEILSAAAHGCDAPLSVVLVERHGTVLDGLLSLSESGAIRLSVLPADLGARLRLADRIRPCANVSLCGETALPEADLVVHVDPRQPLDAVGAPERGLATCLRPGGALVALRTASSGFARLLGADDAAVARRGGSRLLHGHRAVTEVALLPADDTAADRAVGEDAMAALLGGTARACLIAHDRHRLDPDRAELGAAGADGLLVHRLIAADDARSLAIELDIAREVLETLRGVESAPTLCLLVDGSPLGTVPSAAALWAFGRTAMNEYPDLSIRLVGLDVPARDGAALPALARALTALLEEKELVVDAEGLAAVRLATVPPARASGDDTAMQLTLERPGSFERLAWQPHARRAPGPGEIEIAVTAAALNFRDVMFAQGLIGDDMLAHGFTGPSLGFECGGTITRTGPGVSGFRPGEPIVAFAPGAFATHATIPVIAAMKVPAGLDLEAATTLPVAFLTGWYGLVHCARLEAGETVLVHGAAGGVGLAAMQIAKARGARVVATAGTPEKRALARLFGADAVYDSRDTQFASRMAAEGGCDVVLNSLAGRGMELSLRALKPFGRFVELGKRDFVANTSIGLRPFARNLTYFGVDADQLVAARPELVRDMLAELGRQFEAGVLRPLPYRTFPAADVRGAFRLMQGSGHVGKILVRPPAFVAAKTEPAPAFHAASDGVHLVVGGSGGFGREAARWLAANGARNVVVASRRGLIEPALEIEGVAITTERLDVRDRAACAELVARLVTRHGRIAGVVHTAMVLDDALIRDLDEARFEAVLAPKLDGARNLDAATAALDLDYFVLFSSATTLVGNPGQSAYVAANAYLEGLARRRHAQGKPALAVAWGAIADAGVLARDAATSEKLSRRLGLRLLKAEAALAHLGACLAGTDVPPVVVHAPIDWRGAGELKVMEGAAFAALRPGAGDGADGDAEAGIAALIAGLSDRDAQATLLRLLSAEVGRILRLPGDGLDPDRPLADIGMDSLMALELDMEMQRRHKVELPMLGLGAGASLRDIADRLLRKLRPTAQIAESSTAPPLIHVPAEEASLIDRHLQAETASGVMQALRARVGEESRFDGSLLR